MARGLKGVLVGRWALWWKRREDELKDLPVQGRIDSPLYLIAGIIGKAPLARFPLPCRFAPLHAYESLGFTSQNKAKVLKVTNAMAGRCVECAAQWPRCREARAL